MTCTCQLETCIKCKTAELNNAKKKLVKYEQALKILMDESIIQEAYTGTDTNSNLYESIIINKNQEGEIIKKHDSKLGESYIIIDKCKKIEELCKKEKQSIDDLINPTFANLQKRNIITLVSSTTTFSDQYLVPLGHVLADAARTEFGELGTNSAIEIASLKERAEKDLLDMQRGKTTS